MEDNNTQIENKIEVIEEKIPENSDIINKC